MLVVVSGSGTTGVGGLEGTVAVIVGSGVGAKILGRLAGTVVVLGKSAGGDSSSGGCWNRRGVKRSRMVSRDREHARGCGDMIGLIVPECT